MKNSTLLRLFFISIGLPLTCASSSTLKSKTSALVLRDTTNTAPAVQLKDQGILVQSVPEESQVSGGDEQTKRFEELISKKQYKEIAKLGDEMGDDELLERLCQVVTTLDQFEGLFEYLKQREMVPDFLAHGEMVLVREVIVEARLLKTEGGGVCDDIYDAIDLSLEEDRHGRVASLFEAAQERPDWKDKFGWFVDGFLDSYLPEKDSMPLKRFLSFYREEFSKKHPDIFETVCGMLVLRLRYQIDNPGSQKLLIGLVGQPSLLTPAVFAWGFLGHDFDASIANFIKYGYKEVIEEVLREEHRGRDLWTVMVSNYPTRFSGEYPITDETRSLALKDLPTKQNREEAWAKENAPILLERLETFASELQLPLYRDLLSIVAGYALTWADV